MIKVGTLVIVLVLAGVTLGKFLFGLGQAKPTEIVTTKQVEEVRTPEGGKVLEVRSGDGAMTLRMIEAKLPDGKINHTFKVLDAKKNSEWLLFAEVLPSDEKIGLPYNAWSPDNKQLFVQRDGGGRVSFLVYKADGGKYKESLDSLNINDYWAKSKNNYVIKDVTGWEGNDLLRVNTNNEDGSKGPSFWFVISSRAFLRLRG